jgi:glycosyltransferase involved in cell wall biosynthesis
MGNQLFQNHTLPIFALMNIGFDAKRAFQNSTGLGHYSRTLVTSLAAFYPEHHYYLFAPKITATFKTDSFSNIQTVSPKRFPALQFKSLWRSKWVKKDLLKNHIDIYHGLSHEIPVGIRKTNIKSVVTIHDLIFERYPGQYNIIDRLIYRKKFKYACKYTNAIIAISEQTKQDIIEFYGIPEEKITVCYQSCNPAFATTVTENDKIAIRECYNLPEEFYLYVGSIIERKNLLLICKALKQMNWSIPLVVIGNGGAYKEKVKLYIAENNLQDKVIFLSEQPEAIASAAFQSAADFPAIYQMATAMIYPSTFEGFGIPVLEALCSRLPVITSNVSCLPETAGDAALYINPDDEKEMAAAMFAIANDALLRKNLIQKGVMQAQKFTVEKCAAAVMNVYTTL